MSYLVLWHLALERTELRWHLGGGCIEWLCSKEHAAETSKDSTWGLLVSGDLDHRHCEKPCK